VALFVEKHRGATFASQRVIAKDLGISEATLSRHIKRLEKLGKIKRIKKTQRERAVAIL
jgi:DNA-binding MarR family transcriptional regulator